MALPSLQVASASWPSTQWGASLKWELPIHVRSRHGVLTPAQLNWLPQDSCFLPDWLPQNGKLLLNWIPQ